MHVVDGGWSGDKEKEGQKMEWSHDGWGIFIFFILRVINTKIKKQIIWQQNIKKQYS